MPGAQEPRVQHVLDAVYELFFHQLKWPTFVQLDRHLDRQDEPEAESVLLSMPPDLVYGVSQSYAVVQDDQEIALTVAGLALCDGASEDLSAFLQAVQRAAILEQQPTPWDDTPELTSEDVSRSLRLPAAGRADLVKRLGAILRVENWGWSGASHNDERWSFFINRRVRRFRGITTIEEYWDKTRGSYPTAPGSLMPAPSPSQPVADDDDDEPLSFFLSYSHADKDVARQLATALGELGIRVWIDEGELRAGDSIIERVATAIHEIECLVALVSASSVGSPWCSKELSLAVTRGLRRVKVMPVRLGEVEMPASLADLVYRQIDPESIAFVATQLVADARSHRRGPS